MNELLHRIAATVTAVGRGDFEARVVPIGHGEGVEERIAHGLNRILDLVDATLKEARGATMAAAHGEYGRRPIHRGIPGDAARTLLSVGETVVVLERQAHDLEEQRRRQRDASRAFHEQVGNLLAEVGRSATRLVEAMDELQRDLGRALGSMESLSSEVHEVDEHLGSVAAATTQLHAKASEIGDRATGAEGLATTSREEGRSALSKMRELSGSFTQMRRSVAFIDGIARETRMLALNATIEAVHAGSVGTGFGVVASEVKKLAREAATASGEVSEHLEQMGFATQQSTVGVDGVVAALERIGEATTSVVSAVAEQHAAVGDLNRRTGALRDASARMSRRASELQASMQRTRKAMEELARVAHGLSSEARNLDASSQRFAHELEITGG